MSLGSRPGQYIAPALAAIGVSWPIAHATFGPGWASTIVGAALLILAGWTAGRLSLASTTWLQPRKHDHQDAGRLVELFETRLIPALERIADAREHPSTSTLPVAASRAEVAVEVRKAIEARRWSDADEAAGSFGRQFPDDPDAARLVERVAEGKAAAAIDLRGKLGSAQGVNDADGAIGFRNELAALLAPDDLAGIDGPLVRWLMGSIQRRLRSGTMGPDVAGLAGKIADAFGSTPEGASMRAALPTLRRSAGLCPRCAQPYRGVDDACPKCLAATVPPPAFVPAEGPEPEIELEPVPPPFHEFD